MLTSHAGTATAKRRDRDELEDRSGTSVAFTGRSGVGPGTLELSSAFGVENEELTGTPPSRRGARSESNYLTLQTEAGERRVNLLGEHGPVESARARMAAFLAQGERARAPGDDRPHRPLPLDPPHRTGIVVFGLCVLASIPFRLGAKLFRGTWSVDVARLLHDER